MPGNAAFPVSSDLDLETFELLNARAHQFASVADLPHVDGCFGYLSANGDKHLCYWDAQISAAILVPRLDRAESLTGSWTVTGTLGFAKGAGNAPFTTDCGAPGSVGSTATMVTNLSANFLKGYDLDSAASANTLGLRTSAGTMLVANTSGGNSGQEAVNWNTALTLLNRGVEKAAMRVATTGPLPAYTATATTLTMTANGALTIDGQTLALNDRLLVLYEGTGASAPNLGGSSANNGWFYVSQAGDGTHPAILTRTTDADESAEITAGDEVFIDQGTTNGGSQWALLTMGTITVGTTALQFTKVGGSQLYQSGNGIVVAGNQIHFAQSAAYTANTMPYANGTGTIGFTNAAASGVLVTNNSSVPSILAAGTAGQILQAATTPSWSTATYPGDIALGDLLYGSAAHTVGRLAIGSGAQYLQVNGSSNLPQWATGSALSKTDDTNVTLTLGGTPGSALLAAVSITLGWTGTLAAGRLNANVVQGVTNDTNVTGAIATQNLALGWTGQLAIGRGGTGAATASAAFNALSPMTTLGDIIYGGTNGAGTRLAGNTTATKNFLTQTGTGAASAAPAWGTISVGDIGGGAALTKTDDTNITLTLGGTPTTALLAAVSLTLGWTGTLAAARLNANVVQGVTNDTNVTGSIATQNLTLGWTGQLAIGRGGTGAATASAAFNALSPMTTIGDMIYGGASGAGTRLAGNTAAAVYFLTSSGTGTAAQAPAWTNLFGATNSWTAKQTFASGVEISGGNLTLDGSQSIATTANGNLTLAPNGSGAVQVTLARNGALPPTSGTAANGFLTIGTSTESQRLYIGSNTNSPYGLWFQVSDSTALGTNYPLILNPNGGNVGIGMSSPGFKTVIQGAPIGAGFDGLVIQDGVAERFRLGYSSTPIAGSKLVPGQIQWGNTTIAGDLEIGSRGTVASSIMLFTSPDAGTTGLVERWRITPAGILQSAGAGTLQTSTGNLTLATAAGNGNIVLSPNGTGTVQLPSATTVGGYSVPAVKVFSLSTSLSQTINHAMSTEVLIAFLQDTSRGVLSLTQVAPTDANNCTVKFNVAPSTGQYKLVLVGLPGA